MCPKWLGFGASTKNIFAAKGSPKTPSNTGLLKRYMSQPFETCWFFHQTKGTPPFTSARIHCKIFRSLGPPSPLTEEPSGSGVPWKNRAPEFSLPDSDLLRNEGNRKTPHPIVLPMCFANPCSWSQPFCGFSVAHKTPFEVPFCLVGSAKHGIAESMCLAGL